MEPDKTYPLHSDDTSQPEATSPPSIDRQSPQLEVPSSYGQTKDTPTTQAGTVPWYLRPLTKTSQSPLTSTQTRPYVPRMPLSPQQDNRSLQGPEEVRPQPAQASQSESTEQPAIQAPPVSPFRSSATTPPQTRPAAGDTSADFTSSVGRFRMPTRPKQAPYQQALSGAIPKPFSQFGAQTSQSSASNDPTKPSSLRKWIGIILAILLIGGIGTGVYSLWRSNANQPESSSTVAVANAEDKLYQAIDNHLKTSKIRQVFDQTITATDTSTIKLDATSDFSDPRTAKSYVKYELKLGEKETADNGAGELIIQSSNEYFGKLTKPALFYAGSDSLRPKEGQWYALPADDLTGAASFDPLSARTSINSSLGEFPVGNFSDDTRQQMMQYIKEQNVYEIKSSEQVEVDSVKMTHYTIAVDAAKLNELNRRVYAAIGGNQDEMPVDFAQNNTQRIEVWVSDESTKIAKVKIDRESKVGESSTVKEGTTVAITYPNDVSIIAKPENSTAWPTR